MGLEQKAESIGRTLRLKGSLGFWVGALLLMIFAVAAFTFAKPYGERLGMKMTSGVESVTAKVTGGSTAAGGDPRLEGL